MLSADFPIEKIKDDLLNRSGFAENLAKTMLNYDAPEGFVIGVYGKWGSGKTSAINMVVEQIKLTALCSSEKPIIIRFNPWLASDPQQLIAQFFKQLSSTIKDERPEFNNICGYMDDYAEVFDLAGLIPKVGSIAAAFGKYRSKRASANNNNLQKIKDTIISNLRENKLRLIVTIDDIDRLSSEEIVSVFQLVKSLADFPYTIYLLAFDRQVVIEALKDVQKGDGAEYLEKIIQVPFELPNTNKDDIHQIFSNKLEVIIGDVPDGKLKNEDLSELFYFGIRHYLHTIRDVARYINTFAFIYSLLKDEINIIDLIGVTCIQVFEPKTYSKLPHYRELLCGSSTAYSNQYQDEKEKIQRAYNAIVSDVSEEKSECVKYILHFLFPKLNMFSNHLLHFSRYYDHQAALVSNSIANSACFARYFSLSLEPDAIPNHDLNHLVFVASKEEVIEGIARFNASKKIPRFLEYTAASFELNKNSERASMLLGCILLVWHRLDDTEENVFFTRPLERRLMTCAHSLLQAIDKAKRYGIIHSLFSNEEVDLSTVFALLLFYERQNNRFTDKTSDVNEALLSLSDVVALEKAFIERVIHEITSKELIKNNCFIDILWLLEQLDEATAKKLTSSIIYSDLELAYLVSSAVSRGKGSGRTVFTTWNVRKDMLSKYGDINETYSRINAFAYTTEFASLDVNIQENIAAFLIFMDKNIESPSLRDGIMIPEIKKKLDSVMSNNPNGG